MTYPDRSDVVKWVRSFVGLSAINDPNGELARLVDFPGGAPPKQEVLITTNCAMFACGILRQLGCAHSLLHHEYVNGRALAWLLEISHDTGALHLPHDGNGPRVGDILHWATPPKPGEKPRNDDHVAFITAGPFDGRMIQRAGGGAAHNEITESVGLADYTIDHWRPWRHYIDIEQVLR
ncbi:MAG: CHAP domain-containing protein [Bryobacteraceae bacterium]